MSELKDDAKVTLGPGSTVTFFRLLHFSDNLQQVTTSITFLGILSNHTSEINSEQIAKNT